MEFNIQRIRTEILFTIMVIVLLSLTTTGIVRYFSEVNSQKSQITEISMVSIQPIVSLAARAINGGNVMSLKNKNSKGLYENNSNLLYLKMTGLSAGSPKTEYSEAIPPTTIEYTYVNESVLPNMVSIYEKETSLLTDDGTRADETRNVLFVKKTLSIKNGGTVYAVFSAEKLKDIGYKVFKQLLPVFLSILVLSFVTAYVFGNKLLNSSLGKVVAEIVDMTNHVNESDNDIAAAVEEQASITTQQSASLSEITATMEELSISSSQVAENANDVANTSKNTLDESERGVSALNQLKEKMEEITLDNNKNISEIIDLDQKSKEIGKIMSIINDIADQTKMIAFNAAIEASSAGDAGKRFGVVAVEIRRLADNVTESTSEIENKIDEIQKSINRLVIASENGSKVISDGSNVVDITLQELLSIVDGATLATDSAMQISLSTQQQKTASTQVLSALTEIDKGLHQSSASIRQISSGTHNLTDMSDLLKTKLGVLKAGEELEENDVLSKA